MGGSLLAAHKADDVRMFEARQDVDLRVKVVLQLLVELV